MLYAFFSRSKPINFVSLLLLLAVVYVLAIFLADSRDLMIWKAVLNLMVVLFGLLLVDFICKKNGLTKNNTLAPFLFVLLMAAFYPLLLDFDIVLSGILFLIAMRRTISLRTQNNVTQKVFDSSFWLLTASFFNEWCLLFLLAVYGALVLFKITGFRVFLVPWVAVFIVGMLAFTVAYVFDKLPFLIERFKFSVDTDIATWKSFPWNVTISWATLLTIVSLMNYFLRIRKQKGLKRETFLLIVVIFAIAATVAFLGEKHHFGGMMYVLFPTSVLFANLLQGLPRPWMQEVLLGLCALLFLGNLLL